MGEIKIPKKHGLQHTWVWVYQNEETETYTRITYENNIQGADIVCAVKGCGITIPGREYINAVEKMRQFLHLGENEHVERLQEMLEIMALSHESDERVEWEEGKKLGDTVQKILTDAETS